MWEFLCDHGPAQRDYDERLVGGAYAVNREEEKLVVDISHTKEDRRRAIQTLIESDGDDWPESVFLLTVNHGNVSFEQRIKDILEGGGPYDEGSVCDVPIELLL